MVAMIQTVLVVSWVLTAGAILYDSRNLGPSLLERGLVVLMALWGPIGALIYFVLLRSWLMSRSVPGAVLRNPYPASLRNAKTIADRRLR